MLLHIYLIKPSKYDDEGFVLRHWRGVLPSNTLMCLYALTEDVARRGLLGEGFRIKTHILDEAVNRVNARQILKLQKPGKAKVIVCLVGVQSNQFPRAADLAREFKAGGAEVLLGGFHVSGAGAFAQETPPEIKALLDAGVTIVKGEVEEAWGDILRDVAYGKLKPVYDLLSHKPDIALASLPAVNKKYLKRFVYPNFGTLETSRGCPFNCKFCSVINVQGRQMRFRQPQKILAALREHYHRHKIKFYFFTDDNFSRNRHWEEVFDGLIALRREENIQLEFIMQVDTLAYKIPHFVSKAKAAGCTQVFIGLESINPANLEAAGKTHNTAANYQKMAATWREAGIVTQTGYIIGFPVDTPESVARDVRQLAEEVKVDIASFFMLIPLPGSQWQAQLAAEGQFMDPDFNRYDSTHETIKHPLMAPGQWRRAYAQAWEIFYSFEHMKKALLSACAENYWNLFFNFLWYKLAFFVEGTHPMLTGLFRLKDRTVRRPGFQMEGRLAHYGHRLREIAAYLRGCGKLFLEFEELWLQTRKRGAWEEHLAQELAKIGAGARSWRELNWRELGLACRRTEAYFKTAVALPSWRLPKIPSRFKLYLQQANFLSSRLACTREHLNFFWKNHWRYLRYGRLYRIRLTRMLLNFLHDAELHIAFLRALLGRFSAVRKGHVTNMVPF